MLRFALAVLVAVVALLVCVPDSHANGLRGRQVFRSRQVVVQPRVLRQRVVVQPHAFRVDQFGRLQLRSFHGAQVQPLIVPRAVLPLGFGCH